MGPGRTAIRAAFRAAAGLAVAAALSVAVLAAGASPAAACADWLADDRGQLGVIPYPIINTLSSGPGDTFLVTADPSAYERRSHLLDASGNVLIDMDVSGPLADVPYVDGVDLVFGRNYLLFDADGDTGPTAGLAIDGVAHFHPTAGYATGSGWDVELFRPDGTANTAFNGTGSATVDPPRGAIDPTFRFDVLRRVPTTDDSVLVLGVWRGTYPGSPAPVHGSAMQLIEVASDGTSTLLAEETQDVRTIGAIGPSLPGAGGWIMTVDDWVDGDASSRRLRLAAVDLAAGRFVTLDDDHQHSYGHAARDGRGNTIYAEGGTYVILNDDGVHPMVSGARRGEPTELRTAEVIIPIRGLAVLSTGEWALGLRPHPSFSDLAHGIYVFRGTTAPERYIVGGLSGQVTRLYTAALGRPPDAAGLAYFARLRAAGTDLTSLAAIFLASDEFRSRYGGLDDAAFVGQLYRFVLGREGEEQGIAYWADQLATGAIDRAGLLALFADSPENVHRSRTVSPYPIEAELYRLYRAVFLRGPDPDGHCYWWEARAGGVELAEVAEVFVGSAEFQNRYGALDDRGFVDQLYRNVLGRPADPDGLAYWVGQLAAGATRGQVVLGFSESTEFRLATDTISG